MGSDPVEPTPKRRAVLESVDAAPRLQQRLLEHVIGVGKRSHHSIAMEMNAAAMGFDQRFKSTSVADSCRGNEGSLQPQVASGLSHNH